MIRFVNPQFGMFTDRFTNGANLEEGPEVVNAPMMKAFYEIMLNGNDCADKGLYPIKAPDSDIQKMAPAVI
jgi:hypothetical protein